VAYNVGININVNSRGAAAQIQQLQQALGQLGVQAQNVQVQIRQTGAQAQAAAKNVDNLEDSFTRLRRRLFDVQVLFATLGIGLFLKELVEATISIQRIENTFTVVTGTLSGARTEMQYAAEFADKLGVNFEATAQSLAKLLVASKDSPVAFSKVRELFEGTTKAIVALKLGVDDTKLIFLALEQIISKGTLSSEELRRQLGERLPGAVQLTANALGITVDKLMDKLQKGQVSAKDFVDVFGKALEATYGAAAERASQLLLAQFRRLENAAYRLKLVIADGGFNVALTKLVESVTKAFNDTQVQRFARTVGSTLTKAFNVVTEAVNGLKKNLQEVLIVLGFIVGAQFAAALALVGRTISTILFFGAAANPFGRLILGVGALVGAMVLLENQTAKTFDSFATYADFSWAALDRLQKKMQEVFTQFKESQNQDEFNSSDAVGLLLELLKDFGSSFNFSTIIKNTIADVAGLLNVFNVIGEFVKSVPVQFDVIVAKIGNVGTYISDWAKYVFVDVIGGAIEDVILQFKYMGAFIQDIFTNIGNIVDAVGAKIKAMISNPLAPGPAIEWPVLDLFKSDAIKGQRTANLDKFQNLKAPTFNDMLPPEVQLELDEARKRVAEAWTKDWRAILNEEGAKLAREIKEEAEKMASIRAFGDLGTDLGGNFGRPDSKTNLENLYNPEPRKMGPLDKIDGAAKKWEQLQDAISPATRALRDYYDAWLLLNASLAAGQTPDGKSFTMKDYVEWFDKLEKRYRDTIDPAAGLKKELDGQAEAISREIAAIQGGEESHKQYSAILAVEAELKRKYGGEYQPEYLEGLKDEIAGVERLKTQRADELRLNQLATETIKNRTSAQLEYNVRLKDLDTLYKTGRLSAEEYFAGQQAAFDKFRKAFLDENPVVAAIEDIANSIVDDLGDAIADFVLDGMKNFDSFLDLIKRWGRAVVAEIAKAFLLRPLIQGGLNMFAGAMGVPGGVMQVDTGLLGGGGGGGFGGGMGMLSNGMSFAQNGISLWNGGLTGLSNSLGSSTGLIGGINSLGVSSGLFGNGVGVSTGPGGMLVGGGATSSGATSSAGALGATTAGQFVGGVGIGYGLGSLASGFWDKGSKESKLYGQIGAGTGAVAGATIGSMVFPGIGTLIGGAIGGIVGGLASLFGPGKSVGKNAGANVDVVNGQFVQTSAGGDNKGDVGKALEFAATGAAALNTLIQQLGGQLGGDTRFQFGQFKNQLFVGKNGGVEKSIYRGEDPEAAVFAAIQDVIASGTIKGISETMKTVLANTKAKNVQELDEDLGIGRMYEELIKVREETDPFIDALREMQEQFEQIKNKVRDLGLNPEVLLQGVAKNIDKQLDDAILAINDPLKLALKNEEVFATRLLELVKQTGASEYKAQELIAARRMALLRQEAAEVRQLLDLNRAGSTSTSLLGALESVVGALDDVSRSLREQVGDLRRGPLSPLTPEQKLNEARDEFQRLTTLARTGDMDALGKVGEAGNTLLEFSRAYFASSEGYQNDFAMVTTALEDMADFAEQRKSEGEKLVALLEIQQSLLQAIDFNLSSESPNYQLLSEQRWALHEITERITESGILQIAQQDAVQHANVLAEVGNSLLTDILANGATTSQELIDVLTGENIELGTVKAVREGSQQIVDKLNEFLSSGLPVIVVEGDQTQALLTKIRELEDRLVAGTGTGTSSGAADNLIAQLRHDLADTQFFLSRAQQEIETLRAQIFDLLRPGENSGGGPGSAGDGGGGDGNGFAYGGVFGPAGAVRFAYGGVVTGPTTFRMADGAVGLMGEAGWEAVMPLSRGSDGRLGVSVHGGENDNTEVVNELRLARLQQGHEQEKLREGIHELRVEQKRLAASFERLASSGLAFGGRS
jgi:tape measure domain-containing protein